jgi:hypothetical protein
MLLTINETKKRLFELLDEFNKVASIFLLTFINFFSFLSLWLSIIFLLLILIKGIYLHQHLIISDKCDVSSNGS